MIMHTKKTTKMQGYLVSAGHLGLAIGCLSYSKYFTITCTSDEAVLKDPFILVNLLEENYKKCLKEYMLEEASASEAPSPRKVLVQ